MKPLKPFFSYFGSKYRLASRYPSPRYSTIIEPFAGSAGYSLLYPDKQIVLVEKWDVMFGIWSYLIRASEEEILKLPDVPAYGSALDIAGLPQEARWLIGFCIQSARPTPRYIHTDRSRERIGTMRTWGEKRRQRIASQLKAIRHWRLIHGSYEDLEPEIEGEATWFVDPPYQLQGTHYSEHALDYNHLGRWCEGLPGQVIVCEGQDADWLPFRELTVIKTGMNRRSPEMIWTSDE